MPPTDRETLSVLLDIAREAGELVLASYGEPLKIEYKSADDPVTATDRAANELISERLAQRFPGVAVVAEETSPEDHGDYRSAPEVFFVDPIDGTREYIAGTGEFVVMIGLCVNNRAAAGVIYSPTTRDSWCGLAASGSFRRTAEGEELPLQVSSCERIEGCEFVASRDAGLRTSRTLGFLNVGKVQALGSAGLKGVQVASGLADAYLSLGPAGMRWDACAIDALLQGAGGVLTDVRGLPINYRHRQLSNTGGLLGANPGLHAALVQKLSLLSAGAGDTPVAPQ